MTTSNAMKLVFKGIFILDSRTYMSIGTIDVK